MPIALGARNAHLSAVRALLTNKGRREQGRYAFEGPTLFTEALRSNTTLDEIYITPAAYAALPAIRNLEGSGTAVYGVDERAMRRLSDVVTPSGVLCVARAVLEEPAAVLREPGLVLLLADIGDPGNAGTLLRTAEAFGVERVIFGGGGVDPHHPKVVRAAMGASFRLRMAVARPEDLEPAQQWNVVGLAADGEPIDGVDWTARTVLAVGHERRGLGTWAASCHRFAGIPMAGRAESLNAAAAGAIGLYEASKRRPG